MNKELIEKEIDYNSLLQTARDYFNILNLLIVILDRNGNILFINKKGESLLNLSSEEIIGKNWFKNFIPNRISDELKDKFKGFISGRDAFPPSYINPVISSVDEEKIISWQSELVKDSSKRIIAVLSFGEDITEKKQLEQKIVEDEVRFRLLAENSIDLIFRFKIKPVFAFEYISPSIKEFFGYSNKEVVRNPKIILKLIHPDDRHKLMEMLKIKEKPRKPIELKWISKDGRAIWTEQTVIPVYDNNGKIIALDGIARDITERRQTEEKIRFLSFHDGLTELYNRAYFEEELKRLDTKRQLPLSFIMGDVNSLKLVNDSFGHQEGDEFLKNVASLMKSFCRTEDIIARWGGDEFAILLPRTDYYSATEIIERIRNACKKTSRYKIPISISLGLATKEKIDQDISSIISEAEDNMYRRKLLEKKSLSSLIISFLTTTLFEKNIETENHTIRVRDLSIRLGKSLMLSETILNNISILAVLHDIGKIAISDEILKKKDPLSRRELEILKKHPQIGANICSSSPHLVHVAELVLTHHEWFDGSGYPQGISGDNIPVESRIISITDAFDVMTHKQPYKQPISIQEAIEKIITGAGTQFDPGLVKKFLKIINIPIEDFKEVTFTSNSF